MALMLTIIFKFFFHSTFFFSLVTFVGSWVLVKCGTRKIMNQLLTQRLSSRQNETSSSLIGIKQHREMGEQYIISYEDYESRRGWKKLVGVGGAGGLDDNPHSIGKSGTNLRQAYLPRQRENPGIIFLRQVDSTMQIRYPVRGGVNAIKVKPNQINEGNQIASICFDCNGRVIPRIKRR